MRTYYNKEATIREEFDYLLKINEVRNILGCGIDFVLNLIRNGELEAYQINGKAVTRRAIDERTFSIRIKPSSLKAYMEQCEIRDT